jgi:hypothetical protein
MAVYAEGSVRLLWIDRTRRAPGCEETGLLCDPDYVVSGRIGPGNTRGRNVAFIGLRSKLPSTNLDERIGLLATAELHMVLGSLDATDNTELGAEVKADVTTQNISR